MQSSAGKRVYHFNKKCTVLVLDRCSDAVTPLLTPWTYGAMLHEFLEGGITDNTVQVPSVSGQVFSSLNDSCSRFAFGVMPWSVLDEFHGLEPRGLFRWWV